MTKEYACAVMRQVAKKAKTDGLRESAEVAIECIRRCIDEDTRREAEAEAIGNCYIPHLDRPENDFEQGYNSAIRDVLDILVKDRYNKK